MYNGGDSIMIATSRIHLGVKYSEGDTSLATLDYCNEGVLRKAQFVICF